MLIFYLKKLDSDSSHKLGERYTKFFENVKCNECGGTRLRKEALAVKLDGYNINEVSNMELTELDKYLLGIKHPLAKSIILKMHNILNYLILIGVGYLTLNRPVSTL